MASTGNPLRLAFLGCGFITRVHSRHLKALRSDIVCSYASRDKAKADGVLPRSGAATTAYASYEAAIDDPRVDAVLVAVPPRFHLDLTLRALAAGKHVLVEKPAFPCMADYEAAIAARDRARRVVIVGENDHYKPQAVQAAETARRRRHRRRRVRSLHDHRQAAEDRRRLAQRRDDGGRRCVLRGRDPLAAPRRQPRSADHAPSKGFVRPCRVRVRTGAPRACWCRSGTTTARVGSLYYSREIPSLFKGMRLSKRFTAARASSRSSRTDCSFSREGRDCRSSSFRVL